MKAGFSDLINISECDYKACVANEQFLPNEFAIRIVTYHLQQAIEKILKAYVLYYGQTPAFTHDIDELATHCKNLGAELPEELDNISDTLTLWEAKSRYDPYINFTQKKYELAKSVYEKLLKNLKNKLTDK